MHGPCPTAKQQRKDRFLHAQARMDLRSLSQLQIRFLKRWKEHTPKLTSACQKPQPRSHSQISQLPAPPLLTDFPPRISPLSPLLISSLSLCPSIYIHKPHQ